jgi:hypothetical protein
VFELLIAVHSASTGKSFGRGGLIPFPNESLMINKSNIAISREICNL